MMNGIGNETNATITMKAMEGAEENGLLDHGLSITGYVQKGTILTDINHGIINATSIQDLVSKLKEKNALPALDFIADKVGSFNILCTIDCGVYHTAMVSKNAFIVQSIS